MGKSEIRAPNPKQTQKTKFKGLKRLFRSLGFHILYLYLFRISASDFVLCAPARPFTLFAPLTPSHSSHPSAFASHRAVTVVVIPPRAVKAAESVIRRGRTTAARSSRIRFVTSS